METGVSARQTYMNTKCGARPAMKDVAFKALNLASFRTERPAGSKPLAFEKFNSKSRPSADRGYILLSKAHVSYRIPS